MTMKIISAQSMPDHIHFDVWMDTTKMDSTGNPDPVFIRPFDYSKQYPEGITNDEAYGNWMVSDMQKIVDLELASKQETDPFASLEGMIM